MSCCFYTGIFYKICFNFQNLESKKSRTISKPSTFKTQDIKTPRKSPRLNPSLRTPRTQKTPRQTPKVTKTPKSKKLPPTQQTPKTTQRKSPRNGVLTKKTSNESPKKIQDVQNKFLGQIAERRSTLEFVQKPPKTPSRATQKPKITNGITCTRLHRPDVIIFEKIVQKLGGFVVEDEVSSRTTHLVAGEPFRTINMLRAIARGCWIMKHEWVCVICSFYNTGCSKY